MAEEYEQLSHEEHVLKLPDTYIGSVITSDDQQWTLDVATGKMVFKSLQFNPGLYKIFDEVVVNARDAFVRASTAEEGVRLPVKRIDITVANGSIEVENDGDGIPVEEHPKEKCYIPELIFGRLLTSSNYKEGEERIVGGKNGYGAKLANIFSTEFTVETLNPGSGKKYTQTWSNNMSVKGKPSVRKAAGAKGYVKISFTPDTGRFKGAFTEDGNFTEDMMTVFQTRAYELAAMVGSTVKVFWNGVAIGTNTFEKYMKMFLKDGVGSGFCFETCGPRWEVGAVLSRHLYSDEEGLKDEKQISFVNGIQTRKGGKHVDYVSRHVLTDFAEAAKKKKVEIKPGQLKDHVVFFVNATIVNPTFASQTKDFLTTDAKKFGSQPKFTGKLVDGLMKLGLLDEAKSVLEARSNRDAKKTDGSKKRTLRGVPKCDDALYAGTAQSDKCTLILTEGDSAAASANAGLEVVGRDFWGVFPLRGKPLNVREISVQKFNANVELKNLKLILGLEQRKVYRSTKDLRYGRVMIMADEDDDGSHIKGLVMNIFHTEWPQLLELGYICTLSTPLLKASKGSSVVPFYRMQDYTVWKDTHPLAGWHVKYYKGLGTSTPAEAREWFRDLHEIKYEWEGKPSNDALVMAFGKDNSNERKEWLKKYEPEKMMPVADGKATFKGFVDGQLIHFSHADNIRSIPHLMDGFKPSQRKIMFGCFKRGLRSEVRVAQLTGYVSEHAAYHHGEASLNGTIVGMAQNFMGSNNIHFLKPIGQFGSRLEGGKDAASPRYIHTQLEPIVDTLFRKEDQILLKAMEDDGQKVEPEYYLPVVPLLAINGCVGVGTGYSTDIPPHNPEDILTLLQHRLKGSLTTLAGRALDPWWFGFKGLLKRIDSCTWHTRATYTFDEEKKTITVDELPVGQWTKPYKAYLDNLLVKELAPFGLKNFDDLSVGVKIKFVLYMTEEGFDDAVEKPEVFEKNFRLFSYWKTSNMHCFDADFVMQKYDTIGDILEAFVGQRLPLYEQRRLKQLEQLAKEATELEAKRAFLQAMLDGRIVLMRKEEEEIIGMLKTCGIPPLSNPLEPDSYESYRYVVRLPMDRVKKSAIAELDEEVRVKREAMAELEKATPATMWLKDLEEFAAAWTTYKELREEEMKGDGGAATPAPKKKRATTVVKRKTVAVKA